MGLLLIFGREDSHPELFGHLGVKPADLPVGEAQATVGTARDVRLEDRTEARLVGFLPEIGRAPCRERV